MSSYQHQQVRRALSFLTALLASAILASAQGFTVSGTVSSAAGPEPGVVIYVSGDQAGATTTDLEGRFTIRTASSNVTLVFSLIGFKTIEVPVSGRQRIDVVLEEDTTLLEEVVVVGYGTQKKEFVVGSVSQVTSKDILKAPVTNVSSMLAGRLSGFQSIQTTGIPGEDQATMLVRGYTTFNDSSPLCIVDGVERPMSYLNPNDIASISVLKDAATAAIYGVRGANGVILVTTKQGAQGNGKISYDGSVSFDNNTAMPEFCNAEQYAYWHNLARQLDGFDPLWTEENLAKLDKLGILGDTDWLSEIYNKFGLTKQHNLSASGGTDKMRYYASVGYMDQDGILKNTSFDRYNVRANIDARLAEGMSLTLNIAANHSVRNKPGYSIEPVAEFSPITAAYYSIPLLTPTTPDGTPVCFKNGTYYRYPVASLEDSGYQRQKRFNFEGSLKVEYDFGALIAPLQGLKASVFAAYNYSHTQDLNLMTPFDCYYFQPSDILADGDLVLTPTRSQGITERNFNKSSSFSWNMTIRPQIEYARSFGKHNVSFLSLFERYKYYGDTMTAYCKGLYSDYPIDISMGTDRSTLATGSFNYSGFASFANRLGYNYDGKYLAEVTFRADASYKFDPSNRWGYFPSVALGWVVSKEDFFAPLSDKIDFFKIRASYGQLGSDDTSAYLYMQLFNATSNAYVIGGTGQSAFYTSGYLHKDLTWSHTNSYNVGFEARFFKEKLTTEFDWFYKFTDRILEYDSTGNYSPSLGGNYPSWINSGQMDNRGFDLTVRHDNWFANGLTYSITGIVSWSRNKLISKRLSDDHPSYRQQLGQPIGTIYGFHTVGKFQTQAEIDAYPTAPSGYLELGALKYEDVNGDGIISSAYDYVKIGRSSTPEMTFSLGTEIGYKNFHLSVLFQGATLSNYCLSGGYNGTTDNTMFTRAFYGNGNSVLYLVEDAWRPDNTDGKYPRLTSVTNANNAWASDTWIVDGTYLRLKNLQLSYALPKKWVNSIGMDNISVFVAGTNLFTLCEFPYLDPENPGINNGYYPQQKTHSLGVNLTF